MRSTCIFIIVFVAVMFCGCKTEVANSAPEVVQMPVQKMQETEPEHKDEIGRFVYYPYNTKELYAPSGTNEVCFYFEKEGIVANEGYIAVYDAFTKEVYDAIDVSDEKRCKTSVFDDTAKQYTGWETGSCISVFFDRSFLPDSQYYLTLDPGCFMTENGDIYSRGIGENSEMIFGITSYGMNSIDTTIQNTFKVGDTYNLGVILEGKADMAVITDYDGKALSINKSNLSETDYFVLEFLQSGESALTITFYDALGEVLNMVSFQYNVL